MGDKKAQILKPVEGNTAACIIDTSLYRTAREYQVKIEVKDSAGDIATPAAGQIVVEFQAPKSSSYDPVQRLAGVERGYFQLDDAEDRVETYSGIYAQSLKFTPRDLPAGYTFGVFVVVGGLKSGKLR